MSHLLRDLRLAWRSAVRQPGTSLIVILTLAVGIGGNTAIFTYFQELYWLGSPVPDADRVFVVRTGTPEQPEGGASYLDALDYREATGDVGELAIRGGFGTVVALPDGRTTHQIGLAVSHNYFAVQKTHITQGRTFLAAENAPSGAPVVMISHHFWTRYLGADPGVLGRTLQLSGMPFTIVGVTPESFQDFGLLFHIYIPVQRLDDVVARESLADRTARRFFTYLRLHDGVNPTDVQPRLDELAERLDQAFPSPGGDKRHITLRGIDESTIPIGTGEMMMAVAVGLLLLLACANVANLLLARASGRRREIAVLAAVGASRRRIAARLLTESLLLAVAGGATGIFLSRQLLAFMKSVLEVLPLGLQGWAEGHEWLQVDLRVLLFTLALSVLTGGLFGLAPILYAARTDLVSSLKGVTADHRSRRIGPRQALVVLQVLLSTVLLLVSVLLVKSLVQLRERELGYETDRQLVIALSTATARAETPAERRAEERRILELASQRLAALPGIEAAALTSQIPGGGSVQDTRLILDERPDEDLEVDLLAVGDDFFEAFDITHLRGRLFMTVDRAGTPGVVIVNRAFAERFWQDGDPIGRQVRLPDVRTDATGQGLFEVVGQVEDTRHASRRDEPQPLIYVPFLQTIQRARVFAVARTAGPPLAQVQAVHETLSDAHPALAMLEADNYDRLVAFDLFEERLHGAVAGIFGFFGLGLACLGIYGVMSFSVISRRRELAIRTAVGATRRHLERAVLGEALALVAAGVVLGTVATLVLARLLTSLLHGVAPHDPTSFVAIPILLAAIGVAAAWVPAWRAGQTDPNTVLRQG